MKIFNKHIKYDTALEKITKDPARVSGQGSIPLATVSIYKGFRALINC